MAAEKYIDAATIKTPTDGGRQTKVHLFLLLVLSTKPEHIH